MTDEQFTVFRTNVRKLWNGLPTRTDEQVELLNRWYREAGTTERKQDSHWDERMAQCNVWWKELQNGKI